MAQPAPEPVVAVVSHARALLGHAAAAGRTVPNTVVQPILDMQAALAAGPAPPGTEQAFYVAYTALTQATADISKRPRGKREYPFENAVEDAELLLKHASETGATVPVTVAENILAARTALKANALNDTIRGTFYPAYSTLSGLFGDVTAKTIRDCDSSRTGRTLRRNRLVALVVTGIVAAISVGTFVADFNARKIGEDIGIANELAAKLRVGLTPGDNSQIAPMLATDPCEQVKTPSDPNIVKAHVTFADVSLLQDLAATTRAVQGRSIKLNGMLRFTTFHLVQECNPFAVTCSEQKEAVDRAKAAGKVIENAGGATRLQINAAILNYPAEVLCRITTLQEIRSFATNVKDNYTSIVGAVTSYALPILYALLGAYAYRLRLFADTIRKRTYHPSFSDSARMITAVIAGAICGLFNPAQGLALSPLAVAFLVGYGVELFFKLLDTLINSFDTGSKPAK